MSETKLHFTRYRAKGEPDFYDPQTDFRRLLPAAAKLCLEQLQEQFSGHPQFSDFQYLHGCICVLQIRMVEDPAPIDELMREFLNAVQKCDTASLNIWLANMMTLLFSLYGLFCRRDCKVDENALRNMMSWCQLGTYKDVLSYDTYKQMKAELYEAAVLQAPQNVVSGQGFVQCAETGDTIKNVQMLAGMLINHTGCENWNVLAACCDRAIESRPDLTQTQEIALTLAYPRYEDRSLAVEVTNENT